MKKFKDKNNQVHAPEMNEVEGLAFLEKAQPNLKPFTPITEQEATDLLAPPPKTQAELNAKFNAIVDTELKQVDLASMREVRAWVASQPSAPQFLKDLEAEAVAKRATRKP